MRIICARCRRHSNHKEEKEQEKERENKQHKADNTEHFANFCFALRVFVIAVIISGLPERAENNADNRQNVGKPGQHNQNNVEHKPTDRRLCRNRIRLPVRLIGLPVIRRRRRLHLRGVRGDIGPAPRAIYGPGQDFLPQFLQNMCSYSLIIVSTAAGNEYTNHNEIEDIENNRHNNADKRSDTALFGINRFFIFFHEIENNADKRNQPAKEAQTAGSRLLRDLRHAVPGMLPVRLLRLRIRLLRLRVGRLLRGPLFSCRLFRSCRCSIRLRNRHSAIRAECSAFG